MMNLGENEGFNSQMQFIKNRLHNSNESKQVSSSVVIGQPSEK